MVSEGDYVRDEVECPECGGMNTELQWSETYTDTVEHTRTCDDCSTEYVIGFGSPILEMVNDYDE